jgi:hypothetical protein
MRTFPVTDAVVGHGEKTVFISLSEEAGTDTHRRRHVHIRSVMQALRVTGCEIAVRSNYMSTCAASRFEDSILMTQKCRDQTGTQLIWASYGSR